MTLQRLLRMGFSELACRSRQETLKLLERTGVTGHRSIRPRNGFHQVYFWDGGRGRFFEGAMSGEIPALFAQQMHGACLQIFAAADAVCRRRFSLLGYRDLSFGDPVDWHVEPVSGRRAPLVHWSRLNPLDRAVVGDSKIVWELNRHQWLVPLGVAYRITGNPRYADVFVYFVLDWMATNPPGRGINWSSSLEVALRLISWCWALALFRQANALSPEFVASLVSAIEAHALHVERYLSYYFSPNTHLTGEALGLFYAGVLFPELPSAARWLKLGRQILINQSERQVLADGVYFEQSTCYQRYAAEIYLHFLILAASNSIEIPATIREQVQRSLDFLLAVRHPNGTMPQIGDADGGWLLPLVPRAADDARGIFAVGAALFGRPDYAWAAGGVQPEIFWLLGTSGVTTFQALRPAQPVTAPSRVFRDGGYCVMKSGWEPNAHHLIFDVGPLGSMNAGHGHADLLSVQCSVFGEPCLVDPGTYCYTADPDWRNFFRTTAAHSTVTVDEAAQDVPIGPFAWKFHPEARLRRWLSTVNFDLADADHDAYCRLPDPVVHRRRVLFVKPRYWILVDDLQGAAGHQVEVRFQFAPLSVRLEPSEWVRALGGHEHGLLIRAFSTAPLKAMLHEGQPDPIEGWYSPDYGQRQPAPVLVYSTYAQLPCRIVTLLVPAETPSASPPAVFPVLTSGPQQDQELAGLVFGQGEELVMIGEEDIAVRRR